jgi:hypothetical protein
MTIRQVARGRPVRLGSSRLGWCHRHTTVLIHLNDVPAAIAAAETTPNRPAAPLDDNRVRVGVRLDPKALPDLCLEEGSERPLALSERIDVAGHWSSVILPSTPSRKRRGFGLRGSAPFATVGHWYLTKI